MSLLILWAVPVIGHDRRFPAQERWNFLTRDHGKNILRNAPYSCVLFSDRADETEFSLAYLLNVQNARPDLRFVDANAGVSKSIYGDDYYEIWGKPRLARRQFVEGGFLVSAVRPVFYATLDVSQLSLPRKAAGLLYEARSDGRFSSRTTFPYWEIYQWHAWPWNSGSRDRHLRLSTGRLMGDYCLACENPSEAGRFYRLAEFAGANPWQVNLAVWHQQRGRGGEAERLYRQALRRPGPWPTVWNNLGVLYASARRWDKALACYQKAVEQDRSYSEAYYNMGVAYWEQGRWPAVVDAFENTLRVSPDHPGAQKFLKEARRRAAGAGVTP